MKLRTLLCGFVCGAMTMLLTTSVASMTQTSKTNNEIRQAIRKVRKRVESDKKIKHFRGKYTHTIKWWRDYGSAVDESTAQGDTEWVLNSRVVIQHIKGRWLDLSYEAILTLSYDSAGEQYHLFWVDSLANRSIHSTGKLDESGNTITLSGEYVDAMTRETVQVRTVLGVPTRKQMPKLEMYRTDADGKEFKFMEVITERRVIPQG